MNNFALPKNLTEESSFNNPDLMGAFEKYDSEELDDELNNLLIDFSYYEDCHIRRIDGEIAKFFLKDLQAFSSEKRPYYSNIELIDRSIVSDYTKNKYKKISKKIKSLMQKHEDIEIYELKPNGTKFKGKGLSSNDRRKALAARLFYSIIENIIYVFSIKSDHLDDGK